MSLRPRYSLLTLLIITALVACGVKLWRGPHELQLNVSDAFGEATMTRTPEEQQLVEQLPIQGDICAHEHYEYHLRYVNELGRKVFTTGKGIFKIPTYLFHAKSGGILPRQYFPEGIQLEYVSDQKFMEQVACFIFEINQQRQGSSRGHYWIRVPKNRPTEKIAVPLYFITTSKRVFQLEYQDLAERTFRLVTPDQIAEPALAARVAEELAAMK